MPEYIVAIKINNYQSGEEVFHAADPAKIEPSAYRSSRMLVTTRCGIKHTDPVLRNGSGKPFDYKLFDQAMYVQRCARCEKLVDKERVAPQTPVELLEAFAAQLPNGHFEKPGVVRAIEILKHYGAQS